MKVNLNKYRKVLVLLPLFAFFLVILIYLLADNLKQKRVKNVTTDTLSRLNTKLPDPNIPEEEKNKLEIYMQSEEDSLKMQNERDNPSLKRFFNPGPRENEPFADEMLAKGKPPAPRSLASQEKRVNDQLNKILKELNSSPVESDTESALTRTMTQKTSSPDIARLEQLMAALYADTTGDPELRRLDGMLDKILRIQHPNTFTKQPGEDSASPPVTLQPQQMILPSNVFYGLEQNVAALSKQKMAIRAVVHDDQTIQTGSTIKLRLLEDIYIGQQEIPANTFVYGICSISDERLIVTLNRIVHNNAIIPVKLTAYDTDGIEGISVPGAITRDAAKEGLDRTLQTLSLNTLDPSLAAQATSAGIQSLKSLLSRKVKQVKVTVKAGHQVFLQ